MPPSLPSSLPTLPPPLLFFGGLPSLLFPLFLPLSGEQPFSVEFPVSAARGAQFQEEEGEKGEGIGGACTLI